MRLYLVQHGEALPKSEGLERPLTEQGCTDVAGVAAFARRSGVRVRQIWHSGKRRAMETATIFAEHLEPPHGIVTMPGLAPRDDVGPVAEPLKGEDESLMLVGHLPFMSRLASLLVTQNQEHTIVRFQKGGIVCLELDPRFRSWSICWVITPELVSGGC